MSGSRFSSILGFVFGVVFFNVISSAQTQSGRSKYYEPPAASEIREVVSNECGYTISLAGVPKLSSVPGVCNVSIDRNSSYETFRMIRSSTEDLIKHPPNDVFLMIKRAYGGDKGFDVVYEKKIYIFDSDGVEFGLSNGNKYRRVRAFIKDKTAYESFIEVSHWATLQKDLPEVAKAFDNEADRFFNSLRLFNPQIHKQ